jgi:hypothetical protein
MLKKLLPLMASLLALSACASHPQYVAALQAERPKPQAPAEAMRPLPEPGHFSRNLRRNLSGKESSSPQTSLPDYAEMPVKPMQAWKRESSSPQTSPPD